MTKLLPLIIVLILFLGLQIFLSTRKNKYYGLIIPAILFVFLSMTLMFMVSTGTGIILTIIYMYSPIVLLLVVYFICRLIYNHNNKNGKNDSKKEIDKMTIEDL